MDQKSYTMDALYRKYDKFSAPSFRISLNGKELSPSKFYIATLEVEQRADGTAGGCSFTVEGQYDPEKQKWVNSLSSLVKVGAKLSVTGGYVSQKELFYGYVDDYTIEFPEDGAPRISVSGLDGLGYLMNSQKPIYAGKKKTKEIVKTILNQSVSAGFARKVKVGALTGFETPVIKASGDDWKFLNEVATIYGASLFVINGEMIFDDVASKTTPILTLTQGKSLRFFEKRVSLAHQVGKVEIWGRDENQKAIIGSATRVTVGGMGKSAAQLVPALAKATLREYNEFVRTQQECKTMAQNRLNAIAMGLVSGKGRCIGVPELIPGRYIKIVGGDPESNGTYFVTRVRHLFEAEGYQTEFEVKGAKA